MAYDLITELRDGAVYDPVRQQAADALEAKDARIAELEAELALTREEYEARIDDLWEQQAEAKSRQTDYGEGFEEGLAVQAARIAALEAALKPFADDADDCDFVEDEELVGVAAGDLRAAKAAIKEMSDE